MMCKLNSNFLRRFIVCMCLCVYVHMHSAAFRHQKRVSDVRAAELQVVESCPVQVLGTQLRFCAEELKSVTTEPSPQPIRQSPQEDSDAGGPASREERSSLDLKLERR